MKRALLALILALPLALSAQFRIVGTGLFTTINDSTYRAKIDFRPDLTGNSYNATQLNDSMLVLSQKGQLYRLDSFYNASFSSAFIIVVEKNGNWGSPVGQIMVFQNNSSLAAPQAVYGANGATAGMQAGVDTWNALLLKVVSDSAVYWNQAYSNSIDSLNVSGDSLKTITLYRASGDSISATFVDGGGSGPVTDTLHGEVKGPLDSTYIDTVANIIFRLDSTAVGVGEVKYNDTQGSIQQGLKGGNVTNVIGQQLHQRVLNKTGSPLAKGEAVYLQGSQGNRITVAKAIATVDSTSANTFGIVAENIADNQSGYIITEGLITGLNTSALTEGAAVWLSPTVAGGLTTTKPQAPDHGVYIGVCVKQNNGSGELFVKIRNGQELEELHDVRIDSPASNASLYYNTSESVWRDTTGAVLTSDTSVFARDFQISGTGDYIAKFTGSNTVRDANIKEVVGNPSSEYVLRLGTNSDANQLAYLGNRLILGRTNSDAYNYYADNPNNEHPNLAIVSSVNDDTLISVGRKDGASINKARFFVRNSTNDAIVLGVASDNATTFHVSQPNSGSGNVGIATSSPSRPLHVAGTTAIRIPVGNFAQRGTSDNGDIRVRTDTASMEYYSGAWRTVAPMARVPQSGLANRFSKFNANGLLDTSAVLVQNGSNIGIGTTSASVALQVVGDISASRSVSTGFVNTPSPFTTGRPSWGMYRVPDIGGTPGPQIGFTANSVLAMRINAAGNVNIGLDSTAYGASRLNVQGASGQAGVVIKSDYPQLIIQPLSDGNNSLAYNAIQFRNHSNTNFHGTFMEIKRSRGTASAQTATQDGDALFAFEASGNTGGNELFQKAVSLKGNQDGAISGSVVPGRWDFITTNSAGIHTERMTIRASGNVGIGTISPTALLHLAAGTATTAPLKFTSGTNLTTPEAGAVEWNGTNVFVTNSSATRQTVNQGLTGSATIDFASTNAQNSRDVAITITGASDGDAVSLGVPNAAVNANTCYTAWVSAANTVTVRFNNYSSGAVDPASATFKVFVTKF